MKSNIQCPHCDHVVTIETPLAKLGAILGAVVGAVSGRGRLIRGLVRGAAVGGGVAWVMTRVLKPECPVCHHKVGTDLHEAS